MSSILMEIMENTPVIVAPRADDGCGRPPRVGDTGRRSAAARTCHRRARPGRSRRGHCGRCRRHRRSLARGIRRLPCGRARQRPAGRSEHSPPGRGQPSIRAPRPSPSPGPISSRHRWHGRSSGPGFRRVCGIVAGGVAAYRAAGHPVGRQHAVPADRVLRDLELGRRGPRGCAGGRRLGARACARLAARPAAIRRRRRLDSSADARRRRMHRRAPGRDRREHPAPSRARQRVACRRGGVPYLLSRRLNLGGL